MATGRAIPGEEVPRGLRLRAVPVHASDICHVDSSEAIKLLLAAFVLASATFAGCFAITMSR
jgi:hypothetical protein